MTFKRSSGILLHPTSLPSPYGIGDLGPQSFRFVDWLSSTGCKLWQVLPLGPTGYGDSPYQAFSAFAGNPYLISPDDLFADGLLTQEDLDGMKDLPASKVDFGLFIPKKLDLLQKAFSRYQSNPEHLRQAFDYFCAENASWLDDYTLFMALKEANGGGAWNGWPEALRKRKKTALSKAQKELGESITRYAFYQFIFFRQWNKLRIYANERGIQIIGDIPIFVAYDSSDVWSHPELFYLDREGNPTVVAGVPPDEFSSTGQLWGNPLYKWDVHKKEGYAWWLSRVRSSLQIFDILRFDHFRGFAGYYEIPADHATAEFGRWVTGPGKDLFRAVDKFLGDGLITHGTGLPVIAEDLGLVTPDVIELLAAFDLPGMKVLQFAFSGPDNPFLPHNYVPNSVAYTGTHDNDTARGWFEHAAAHEREFAQRYLGVDGNDFAWDLIRGVWKSVAVMAITPMQDLLNLGSEARMNFPSKLGGNWEWRMGEQDLREDIAARLRDLNWLTYR
ncbi:4-alpha-glucanotransferase [Candidatus Villigracilis affinis]|uniref:4-alpha-glucanotransferase n=1 Tax=Candidatus Villigracilis affinis TaxID=3140682 RepID=UPI002A21DC1C|nr:4-alpha-glucanotransferase [Anaerolineales bacterium]